MKLVSLYSRDLQTYTIDSEMLKKSHRPCVLILRLKYKGARIDFAVPLRSNIPPSAPKNHYFALPPRPTTKSGHRHGIHYIKMFPIDRTKAQKFNTDKMFYSIIKAIIDKNEKLIVSSCQKYLKDYESGIKPPFSTDIDLLLNQLNK